MNSMDQKSVKKITFIVNSVILVMVLFLMLFFWRCHVGFMVYFSLPTFFVYLFGYILIYKDNLLFYLCMVYCWLTLYMGLATVCVGHEYGFHLYSMSMIPIIYYANYMAYKMNAQRIKTVFFSGAIIICYLVCTLHVSIYGAIYPKNELYGLVFWVVNSLIVFSFLVYYTRYAIESMINSEEKLRNMSYVDKLTGLYNRHYMMEQLDNISKSSESEAIALIDIDDFKKINDVYGHNAGDYVLETLASLMKENCPDEIVSRWGGEEFLILIHDASLAKNLMENLRDKTDNKQFVFEDKTIKVSVTIGIATKDKSLSIDKWIQKADENLYLGKNRGKNTVVE